MTAKHLTPCRGADLAICLDCARFKAHAERPQAVAMKPMLGRDNRCVDYVASKPGAEV